MGKMKHSVQVIICLTFLALAACSQGIPATAPPHHRLTTQTYLALSSLRRGKLYGWCRRLVPGRSYPVSEGFS